MGLLAALDLHKCLESETAQEFIEVEYQLYSWGEIYPPFLGNREHSIVARYVLKEFPFKVFSSSAPYDDPLPQKLSLTFRTPYEVKKNTKKTHVSGIFSHEIAKEFAAFLSLFTRRRIFVSRQTRSDGLPIEQELDLYQRSRFQERQRLKEIEPRQIYQLFDNLHAMNRRVAKGFILAMRLYHSAVEMMYTEPEFSYLFLITCLETISSAVCEDYKPNNQEEFLTSRFSGLTNLLRSLLVEHRAKIKQVLLKNEKFAFQKLLKFVSENIPDRFWFEIKDDAKPDFLTGIFERGSDGLGQERISHSNITIKNYEKIEKDNLKQVLRNIYDARSRLIHNGVRLPASIVIGHFRRFSVEAVAEITETLQKNQTKGTLQIPPLLTFEKLVSYSMVEFLCTQRGESINAS